MQFKFSQYQYQTDAADVVCDVFDGQPLQDGVSYIRATPVSVSPHPKCSIPFRTLSISPS